MMLNFLKKLLGCRETDLDKRIKVLENEINYLIDTLSHKQINIDNLDIALTDRINELNNLQQEYEAYMQEYTKPNHLDPEYEVPTDIINTSIMPYLPNCKFYYWNHTKIDAVTVKFTPGKFYRIWSDEMYHFFRDAIKDCNTFDEKVVRLRNVIKQRVAYKYDVNRVGTALGENWRLPTDTYYGKIGDCEDTTILWVTACHICGLPADRVFNGTGYYHLWNKWNGHSFGIAKFDDGIWRVIETTSMANPVIFQGSNYKTTGILGGLHNWNMTGQPIQEQF